MKGGFVDREVIKHPLTFFIWKHWVPNFVIYFIICVAIFIKIFFYTDKEYTANLSIIPSAASFSSGISGQVGVLANLAGINLSNISGQSQEMYQGILTSRRLLTTVLFDTFIVNNPKLPKIDRLINYLDIEGKEARDSLEKALKKFNEEVMDIGINADNNILNLEITLRDPFLAAAVANRMAILLDEIVQKQVQREYYEQLYYITSRIEEIKENLKIGEKNLKDFLDDVRNPNLPANQVEELRLRRELEVQSVIYAEILKQKEVLIIQNMINLSHIKILDNAIPPFRKSKPKRALVVISLGFLAAVGIIGINGGVLIYRKLKQDFNHNQIELAK